MTFLKQIAGAAALGATLLLGSGLIISPAQARYVVTLEQAGNDVIATGSGAIDLTGLTFALSVTAGGAIINPEFGLLWSGVIRTGPIDFAELDLYGGLTGPASFGSGLATNSNSDSGDPVGIFGNFGRLFVPEGYLSGNPLSNTSTYLSESFNSLGVTPGTYVWTWGEGENQNVTLIIGTSASVPEPASALLLGMALAGLLLAGMIRRTRYAA